MKIEVVPCKLAHLRELANNMRPGDAEEAAVTGRPCRHLLVFLWKSSVYSRAALVDGQVAAAWGCTAPLLVSEGEPWLFTTPVVEKAPIACVKVGRREVARMLRDHRSLVSSVASDYTKAVNFLRRLGFSIGAEHLVGPAEKPFREIRVER